MKRRGGEETTGEEEELMELLLHTALTHHSLMYVSYAAYMHSITVCHLFSYYSTNVLFWGGVHNGINGFEIPKECCNII